ncbi:MAG: cbb3-type cytochrome c oxidase subunit I [Candidatus Methylomirabilis sp.]|nr:cbb3-type cytochrome c oxidase subunit I [Deltaproteobacteria bacterium]
MRKETPYIARTIKAENRALAHGWLILAVFSLVFAGVFALLVALARTPVVEEMLPLGRDYIYVALVGHVVLAVVIWFLAFKGFLWVYSLPSAIFSPALGRVSLALSALGMALVVIAAVFGLGQAELANYVPVLLTPVFYAGLLSFGAGVLLSLLNFFLTVLSWKEKPDTFAFGMLAAGAAVIIAFACFALSGWFQHAGGKMHLDFERLFWGGGHILQFANTMAMSAVWLLLVKRVLGKEALGRRTAKALYALFIISVLPAPAIYFLNDISSQAHKESFTWLMRWGIGPLIAVFILASIAAIARTSPRPWKDPAFSSLVLSISIFLLGGFIGLSIDGVNTIIPAHYHCVIGAVTIAFMGLFYEVLPDFRKSVWSKRMATAQPWLYSAGIVLFALGLFLAGSHGVARKTYGGEQNLNTIGKLIGMSIMGLGGLVAIAGGVTFVLNALFSLFGRKAARSPAPGIMPAP